MARAPQSFGPYQILGQLATGGTAEVFLARHAGAGGVERTVVVKQLLPELAGDPEFRKMFLDEARLGAKLTHPNVVYTYEMGDAGGRLYIALEYLAGLTVSQLAARARQRMPGGLPIELAVALMRDACLGLHAAHEVTLPDGSPLQLVHRDVSPQNIIATYGGDVKLVDFGIAHAAVREARTRTGMIKGKFAYMAPEQCLGKAVDRRTDIFAVGVVLYELVTKSRLFKRPTSYETYQAILRGQVAPASELNPMVDGALNRVLFKALAANPDGRHPTAGAMADELDRWLQGRGFGATQPALLAFYQKHFAAELDAEQQRLGALVVGKPSPESPPAWDDEDSDRERRPVPVVAGPDERTALAAAPSPPATRAESDSWKPLLWFAVLLLAAVVIAVVARLLG